MSTKRSTAKKPRVTEEMLRQRRERLSQLGTLLQIGGDLSGPAPNRFIFIGFGPSESQLRIDSTFETLGQAQDSYSTRGDWDFGPNPAPRLVVDLDSPELAVTAVSYNQSAGMELEDEFGLEAGLDDEYEPEPGGSWRDAYWLAPTVNPELSAAERSAKLYEWLECEWRNDWDPDED